MERNFYRVASANQQHRKLHFISAIQKTLAVGADSNLPNSLTPATSSSPVKDDNTEIPSAPHLIKQVLMSY